jgi:molybdenum cofactor biosynthesis enzyme MoaA
MYFFTKLIRIDREITLSKIKIFFLKYLKFIFPRKKIEKILINLSKKKVNNIEITPSIGCAMMCNYCPQLLITTVSKKNNEKNKMDYNEFKLFTKNIPDNTVIHWTGYTEPLLHKDFDKFVMFLHENNFDQLISTTMHGYDKSQNFMSSFNNFISVNFHLPDNKNLMKIKVSDSYLEKLEKAILFQAQKNKKNITFQVIGEDFEFRVKKLLNKLVEKDIILKKNVLIENDIASRSDAINVDDLNFVHKTSIKKSNQKNKLFYCSDRRLNQAVMLPDGNLNICCMDYSLSGIIGSIKDQNLNDIYSYNDEFNKAFVDGSYKPCVSCEYYKFI